LATGAAATHDGPRSTPAAGLVWVSAWKLYLRHWPEFHKALIASAKFGADVGCCEVGSFLTASKVAAFPSAVNAPPLKLNRIS